MTKTTATNTDEQPDLHQQLLEMERNGTTGGDEVGRMIDEFLRDNPQAGFPTTMTIGEMLGIATPAADLEV
jgi:hypothetical protein